MPSDDWYRNYEWNAEVEALFYNKLKRARSQRDQYVVIQASYLAESAPKVALSLIDEYFDTRKDQYEDMRAFWVQARSFMNMNQTESAMESFRSVLKREDEFPNHQSTVYVDYPYIVATQAIDSEYKNALDVLEKYASRLMFALDKFKWHASKALINIDANEASLALQAAEVKRSGFRFHQDVGLVGKEHIEVIKVLRKIST